MPEHDPAALFERLPALIAGDAWLVHRGRFFSGGVGAAIGDVPFHLEIERGRLGELRRGKTVMRSTVFRVRGAGDVWTRHWRPMPEPGFHDLLAMMRFGHVVIEGELQKLMANLQYVKDLLAAPRRLAATELA
jgi:hypothetical protein